MPTIAPSLVKLFTALLPILTATSAVVVHPDPNAGVQVLQECVPATGPYSAPQYDLATKVDTVCNSITSSLLGKSQWSVYYPTSNNLIMDFSISVTGSDEFPDADTCKGHFYDIVHECKHAAPGNTVNYGGSTCQESGLMKTFYNITIASHEVVTLDEPVLNLPHLPIRPYMNKDAPKVEEKEKTPQSYGQAASSTTSKTSVYGAAPMATHKPILPEARMFKA